MVNIPIDVNIGAYVTQIIIWVGYTCLGFLLVGVMGFIYYYITFNIKADVWKLYGSSKNNYYSVGRKKTNRVKWINNKTAWKSMWPLFNKNEHEPFNNDHIYAGNRIQVFDLNGVWIPGSINLDINKDGIIAAISPVPNYIRNWQSIQHKKHAEEFSKHNFWEDNKYFLMGVLAVLICCVLCGVTVYFTYNFASGGTEQISGLADALRNFNVAQGVPKPGG